MPTEEPVASGEQGHQHQQADAAGATHRQRRAEGNATWTVSPWASGVPGQHLLKKMLNAR